MTKLLMSFVVSIHLTAGPPSPPADNPNQTCISQQLAKNCLQALQLQDLLQDRAAIQGQTLTSQAQEIQALKDQNQADAAALQSWQSKLQVSEAAAQKERAALDAWYHDPFIMSLLGFATGVAATSAVVVVVSIHH